jgi:hypothetical protein
MLILPDSTIGSLERAINPPELAVHFTIGESEEVHAYL